MIGWLRGSNFCTDTVRSSTEVARGHSCIGGAGIYKNCARVRVLSQPSSVVDRSLAVTDDSFSLSLAVFFYKKTSCATGTHEEVYCALNISGSEALGQAIVEDVGLACGWCLSSEYE